MKDKAMRAQRASIKGVLTCCNVGGRRSVRQWDDLGFYLCAFSATTFAAHAHTGYDSAKRVLERMTTAGDLDRLRPPRARAVRFRFPRAVCDQLAAEVMQELLDEGLEMDSRTRRAA